MFLGPTLEHDVARTLLDATYMPPVSVGDVYRAVSRGAAPIVIIDGYFQHVPAVWHKEILYALSLGVAVYGSSSMGALRAAELHAFGMIGAGSIYRGFVDGDYEDDDEVAVAHLDAAAAYRPTSEAMVNIRHGLGLATRDGVITAEAARRLTDAAKSMFYAERNWSALLDSTPGVMNQNQIQVLRDFLDHTDVDLKRQDAHTCLTTVSASPHDQQRSRIRVPFAITETWISLIEAESGH